MSKIFWFLGLCLSTVGVTGALQAGQNPSKSPEGSQASSSEADVPDELVDSSEGAASAAAGDDSDAVADDSAAAGDDSASAAPAKLSVRDQVRRREQANKTPESIKPIRSGAKLSPEQIMEVGAGIVRGPLAGAGLIARRNALRAELQAKQLDFQAEDAKKQPELDAIQGGWGVVKALDYVWGGKKAAYEGWRAGELRYIQVLGEQLREIEEEMEARGIRG